MSWLTVSKAFVRSRKTSPVYKLLLILSKEFVMTSMRAWYACTDLIIDMDVRIDMRVRTP